MGYETKIYIVQPYTHGNDKYQYGQEIASLDLCKVGYEGNLSGLISRTKKYDGLPWALWARNPDRQQEAVEYIRGSLDLLDGKEHKDAIQQLSNDIEDGVVTDDMYGEQLGCIPIKEFIAALKQELEIEDYRRYRMALALCEAAVAGFEGERELVVLTFGH